MKNLGSRENELISVVRASWLWYYGKTSCFRTIKTEVRRSCKRDELQENSGAKWWNKRT